MSIKVHVIHNRFPTIKAALAPHISAVVEDVAQNIATDAKLNSSSESSRVAATITVGRDGPLTRHVVAGDDGRGFFAGFVEYGTHSRPATPFMTPSAETHRPDFMSRILAVLR